MNMEQNKILAAFLVAGIIGMLAWFVTEKLYTPAMLAENAYKIEVTGSAMAADAPAAATGPEPIDGLMTTASLEQGEKVGKVCASCHSFGSGEPHRIGPNLFGIFGNKTAHAGDYPYSDGMKAKNGTWNAETLNKFLWNPKKDVPGTKMTFAGIKKPEDRAALIKWLQSLK